jgi:hypothetical protein
LKWFESTCRIVEVSQIVLHEGGEPNALVDLFDAEFLTGQDLAKVDFPPVEADSPARRDGDDLVVEGVVELGQACIGAR